MSGNYDSDIEMLSCKCLKVFSRYHFFTVSYYIVQRYIIKQILKNNNFSLYAMLKDDDEEIQQSVSTNCLDLRQNDLFGFLKGTKFFNLYLQ